MKIVLGFILLAFSLPLTTRAQSQNTSHEEIERDYHPKYLNRATGVLQKRRENRRHPWPVTVKSIGHTMASYQRYGGLDGAYFHHGLDIRADAGSDVLASIGGQVINVENYMPGDDAYWEVAILDQAGFVWQYHHIERDSIPEAIFYAYKNHTPISAGTKLGQVYYWPIVTFGERYHHIHLNILGKNKEYLNPFAFLELLPDSKAPEIAHFYLIKNGTPVSGNSISKGNYTVGVEIKDLILSDVFVVPANEIKVAIDGENTFTVWKFDGLPGGSDNEKFVNQFYLPKLTCGDYNCRKPVIDLGFRKTPGQVFPLSTGTHNLELWVSDYNGNETRSSFDWTVE